MNATLLQLAETSLQLGLLRSKLETRAASSQIPQAERTRIALGLPLLAEERRDIDREINELAGQEDGGTLSPISQAVLDELRAATEELARAIVRDNRTDNLLELGHGVAQAAGKVRGASSLQ